MFLTGAQVKLGKIGGHEIRLDLIAFGMLGLMIYLSRGDTQGTVAFLVAAFFSILIHEMGHAAAIRKLTRENTIVVMGFGGATISFGPKRASHQLWISLAGPAAQFAIGVVGWTAALWLEVHYAPDTWQPWAFATQRSIWLLALQDFIFISLIWSVLNLAPMLPLDGGQALRALLVVLGGAVRPVRRITRIITIVVAVGLGIWAYDAGYRISLAILLFFVVLPTMDEARSEGW